MIIIYSGEDTAKSRLLYTKERDSYIEKGYHIISIERQAIGDVTKWMQEAQGLFEQKMAFFGENLLKQKECKEVISSFEQTPQHILVLWENDIDTRIVKKMYPSAQVVDSKFDSSIFSFLDGIVPGNGQRTISTLNELAVRTDEHIIFYMLCNRVRDLILVSGGKYPSKKVADWQMARLKSQANKWEQKKLIAMYNGFFRIDVYSKTSQNYYSIVQALDILFAYYL